MLPIIVQAAVKIAKYLTKRRAVMVALFSLANKICLTEVPGFRDLVALLVLSAAMLFAI